MHKYVCDRQYGNRYCQRLCLACKNYLTQHIKKPVEPRKEACCGDSCPNCVWTVYFEEKTTYEEKVKDTLNKAFEKAKSKADSMKNAWEPFVTRPFG